MLSSVTRLCPYCGHRNTIDLDDLEARYRVIYRNDVQEIQIECAKCKDDFVIVVRDAEAPHES